MLLDFFSLHYIQKQIHDQDALIFFAEEKYLVASYLYCIKISYFI